MSIIMLKPPPKQFPSHQTVANEKIGRVIRKIIVRDHFCPPVQPAGDGTENVCLPPH